LTILGIDPGLAIVGFGVIKKQGRSLEYVAHGVIKTQAKERGCDRLLKINKDLKKIIQRYQPKCVAVEDLFMYKNVKTAMKVGEARGVILLTMACTKSKLKIFQYTPLQIKQGLTGYGRASKVQIQKMVKNLLGLKKIPKPDDAADALAIAILAAQTDKNCLKQINIK